MWCEAPPGHGEAGRWSRRQTDGSAAARGPRGCALATARCVLRRTRLLAALLLGSIGRGEAPRRRLRPRLLRRSAAWRWRRRRRRRAAVLPAARARRRRAPVKKGKFALGQGPRRPPGGVAKRRRACAPASSFRRARRALRRGSCSLARRGQVAWRRGAVAVAVAMLVAPPRVEKPPLTRARARREERPRGERRTRTTRRRRRRRTLWRCRRSQPMARRPRAAGRGARRRSACGGEQQFKRCA